MVESENLNFMEYPSPTIQGRQHSCRSTQTIGGSISEPIHTIVFSIYGHNGGNPQIE